MFAVRLFLILFLVPLAGIVEAASRVAAVCQIEVNANAGYLTNGCVIAGCAWMDRQSWIAAASQPASYYWQLPINRMAWNQVGIQFTPTATTTVTFKLTGPWEEVTAGSGLLYKEEVLWDGVSATGTTFVNPGFENLNTDGTVADWRGGTSQTNSSGVASADGKLHASSWQQNGMLCTLRVTNGVAVRIQLYARAAVPPDFAEMKRIVSHDTPAHLTARKLMRGVNLSGLLELPANDSRALSYSERDFIQIRAEGFDHVRIPVGWHLYTGASPDFTLSPIVFSRLDALVSYAFHQNLAVLVDWHGFDEFAVTPFSSTNKLFAVWRQVAEHYANYSPNLCFEVLNEEVPLLGGGAGAATSEVMNAVYAEAIRQIRVSNPNRTIVTGTSGFDSIEQLAHLRCRTPRAM